MGNEAAIADDLLALFRRYISAGDAELTILPLWVLHTHAFFGVTSFTPYLCITSAEKGCGKTRVLEVLHGVVREPLMTGSISPAALARTVERNKPTMLLDELDAIFKGDKEIAEAMRGILNHGYHVRGTYTRMVGNGAKQEERHFSTFCPKALAGIGTLPDTVAARSIVIRLKRVPRGQCESFRPDGMGQAAKALRRQLDELKKRGAEWAKRQQQILANSEPNCPEEFLDRQRDISEPLLAIADVLGGKWPTRARDALRLIFASPAAKDRSKKVELLADIRRIFALGLDEDRDRLPTSDLIAKLVADDSPWSEWNHGKPLTAYQLSRLLSEFEIAPRTIRFSTQVAKGYEREWFLDAWSRYLPPSEEDLLRTCNGSKTEVSSSVDAGCNGVTAPKGG